MSTPLHTLRCAHGLSRVLLLWLLLYLGVAVLAPWIRPQALALACGAAGGLKLVPVATAPTALATAPLSGPASDAGAPASGHTLDCPLCLTASAPPPAPVLVFPPAQPLAHALHPLAVARIAALLRSPALPRAPPAPALAA